MERIGIVDLGSGTARLVVYHYESAQWFRLIDEVRDSVRLGEHFAATGSLEQFAIERGLEALRMYADYATATKLGKLEVIATSVVREAKNRAEFTSYLQDLPLEFNVLSGEQEAQFGVLAVANSFDFEDAWVMDLGGGSAQVSKMEQRFWKSGQAFPLGSVRLTEMFFQSDPPTNNEIQALEFFVKNQMGHVLDNVRNNVVPFIAMGGTIRNLARAVQKQNNYPMDLLHGYSLRRKALENLIDKLSKLKANQRGSIAGIHPDRGDVILAGALVYQTVMRQANLNEIIISGQGVREGAFYRHFLPEPYLIQNVRDFSIQNVFAHYAQPKAHTERVRWLAKRLFDGLQALHGYGLPEARLLDDAAMLHDIGMTINYYDHHKHSAYLVVSASIPGLTPREQALVALLVQYHRKGDPKLGVFKSVLESEDDKRLLTLSTLLRLAEFLERSRAGRVTDLNVQIKKKTVRIQIQAFESPRVELREANKQAGIFRKAFDRELLLEV